MKMFFAALLVSSLVLAGCSEISVTPGNPYYVTAQVEGEVFEATEIEASFVNDVITIEAEAGPSMPKIHLMLTGADMRDFDLGRDLRNEASISFGAVSDTYWSKFHVGEGQVTITRLIETEAQGTFWFKAMSDDSESVEIQKGRFSVYFDNN